MFNKILANGSSMYRKANHTITKLCLSQEFKGGLILENLYISVITYSKGEKSGDHCSRCRIKMI